MSCVKYSFLKFGNIWTIPKRSKEIWVWRPGKQLKKYLIAVHVMNTTGGRRQNHFWWCFDIFFCRPFWRSSKMIVVMIQLFFAWLRTLQQTFKLVVNCDNVGLDIVNLSPQQVIPLRHLFRFTFWIKIFYNDALFCCKSGAT